MECARIGVVGGAEGSSGAVPARPVGSVVWCVGRSLAWWTCAPCDALIGVVGGAEGSSGAFPARPVGAAVWCVGRSLAWWTCAPCDARIGVVGGAEGSSGARRAARRLVFGNSHVTRRARACAGSPCSRLEARPAFRVRYSSASPFTIRITACRYSNTTRCFIRCISTYITYC